jgi:hypothetical protein
VNDADVPQEGNDTLGGGRKAIYARGEDGKVRLVTSLGWQVEEIVTRQALDALDAQAEEARQRCLQGFASPLEYHMYRSRMDLPLLCQTTGFWRWRVRRHCRPEVFSKLPEKVLRRYSDALGIPVAVLREVAP